MVKQAKRGRKKGSYSFVMVLMSDLKTQVADTEVVVLSSKYADSMGIKGQPVKTVAGSNMMIPVGSTISMPSQDKALDVEVKNLDSVKETNDNDESASLQIEVQDW